MSRPDPTTHTERMHTPESWRAENHDLRQRAQRAERGEAQANSLISGLRTGYRLLEEERDAMGRDLIAAREALAAAEANGRALGEAEARALNAEAEAAKADRRAERRERDFLDECARTAAQRKRAKAAAERCRCRDRKIERLEREALDLNDKIQLLIHGDR